MTRKRDGDDGWVEQVHEALDALGLLDEHARADLIDSIEEVLTTFGDDDDDDEPLASVGPRVRVLDGGRTDDDEDDDEHEAPDLRVVDGLIDGEAALHPRVSVRVLGRPGRPTIGPLTEGRISLPGGPDGRQTLRHGTSTVNYRVHCDEGDLELLVDGHAVAHLQAGQSIDVEGAVLRARASGDRGAIGRFTAL
jgi:hypothetical protein